MSAIGVREASATGAGLPLAPSRRERRLRPLVLLMAGAAAAVALGGVHSPYPLVPWLVGLTLASFILTLNGPAWALVPVLATELTLSTAYLPWFGLSQRLGVTLCALLLTASTVSRLGRSSDPRLRRVLVPSVAFIIVATAVNSLFSADAYVVKYLRYQVTQLLALLLVATLLQTRRDVRRIALVVLGIGLVVAVASIWQHYAPSSAPYGIASTSTVRDWKGRTVGLSESPVMLAKQINFVLMGVLGVLLAGPWRRDRTWILLGLALLILAGGLNFSYTRSAVFAIAPAVAGMGLLLRGRRRLAVLGLVVAGVILFQGLQGTGLIGFRYYRGASDDQSAASHAALWKVDLAIAMDHPLVGIGHERFEEVAAEYADEVSSSLTAPDGASAVGQERPHNDFLSVWLSWGIVALVAYLAIMIGALRNFARASRHPDLLIRGLAVGCFGGLIAYAVDSAFHNSMDSTTLLWIYAGLSVALARLSTGAGGQRSL